MYEVMMYAGIIGCIVFFVLSVILFIKNKIPSSIMYFVDLRRKGVDIGSAKRKRSAQQASGSKKKAQSGNAGGSAVYEPTQYLDEAGDGSGGESGNAASAVNNVYEPTEYLDDTGESPTELLP